LFFKEKKIDKELKSLLIQVVKASFGNRRKTIKNSLGNSIFKELNFTATGIDLTRRAEQLDIKEFEYLADYVLSKSDQSEST
jgi:16S rRNA (adenine1518-N6/adenine1519-N6)-dimethyltransferase